MRIAFLGFGLIGGSVARAVHARAPEHELVGWSPSGLGPARAVADGVLVHAAWSVLEAVANAELVILGAPPLAAIDLVRTLAAAGPALAHAPR